MLNLRTMPAALPALLAACMQIAPSPPARAADPEPDPPLTGVARVRADAEKLRPLFETEAALRFLDATERLPSVEPRIVHVNKAERRWLTPEEAEALTDEARAALEERTIDEDAFYHTFYGSPLVYARVLEVAGNAVRSSSEPRQLLPTSRCPSVRVLDFGYGSIGQLRLLDVEEVVGVDVDHRLAAIYRFPADVERGERSPIHLVHARWPAEESAIAAVNAVADRGNSCHLRPPRGFDLVTSKNTLKNGYINPAREVDERLLVRLGVTHEEFLREVHRILRPGGLFVIYNLSPRLSRDDEPYKPWSDGRCPFPREMLFAAGFEVLAFDENDDPAAARIFEALGYPTTNADGEQDLFALYTIAHRPVN